MRNENQVEGEVERREKGEGRAYRRPSGESLAILDWCKPRGKQY